MTQIAGGIVLIAVRQLAMHPDIASGMKQQPYIKTMWIGTPRISINQQNNQWEAIEAVDLKAM